MSTIPAYKQVRGTGCAVGSNTVTITLTCVTATAARELFGAVSEAVKAGDVSLQLREPEATT